VSGEKGGLIVPPKRLLDALAAYGEGYARERTIENLTDEEGCIRLIEETEQY